MDNKDGGLAKAGKALYGVNWKNQLARDLDVNPTRIRDWSAGKRDIPPGIWASIVALLKQRRATIDAVLRDIE